MNKLILLASLLAFTATAQPAPLTTVDGVWRPAEAAAAMAPAPRQGTQERLAALETQVFGKPSVAPRVAPAAVTPEAAAKAKADRDAARAARVAANPTLAAQEKARADRRAAALAAREERLKALGGSKVLAPGQPVKPLNQNRPVK